MRFGDRLDEVGIPLALTGVAGQQGEGMRWLGVLATAGLVACGDKSTGLLSRDPIYETGLSGSYGLASINGSPLPQNFGRDGLGAVDVLAGTIHLRNDATYTDVLVIRRRGGHGVEIFTDTIRGGYLHIDRTVMMTPSTGGDMSFYDIGDDGSLSNEIPGFYLVYRKD